MAAAMNTWWCAQRKKLSFCDVRLYEQQLSKALQIVGENTM
jgi:hypothetical protein